MLHRPVGPASCGGRRSFSAPRSGLPGRGVFFLASQRIPSTASRTTSRLLHLSDMCAAHTAVTHFSCAPMDKRETIPDYERERGKTMCLVNFTASPKRSSSSPYTSFDPPHTVFNDLTPQLGGREVTPDLSVYEAREIDYLHGEVRLGERAFGIFIMSVSDPDLRKFSPCHRILDRHQKELDLRDEIDWEQSNVDGTTVPASRAAAGGPTDDKKGSNPTRRGGRKDRFRSCARV